MTVRFLFFDDFETLDIFGPIEILAHVEGAELRFVSSQGGLIKSRQGYAVRTDCADLVEPGGVIVVPGGRGTRRLVNDPCFLASIKSLCEGADYVLSICTGSALLAKAGLLDGRRATSNKKAFDWVTSQSTAVRWVRDVRWVVDGKYYTSEGVSAGMDMALGFVSDLFGSEKAQQIADDIEYSWK